jgi:hypothetical protein
MIAGAMSKQSYLSTAATSESNPTTHTLAISNLYKCKTTLMKELFPNLKLMRRENSQFLNAQIIYYNNCIILPLCLMTLSTYGKIAQAIHITLTLIE